MPVEYRRALAGTDRRGRRRAALDGASRGSTDGQGHRLSWRSTGATGAMRRPPTASATTRNSCFRCPRRRRASRRARCMDCGIPYLPQRLPGQQPDPGLERPRLSRRLGGGVAQPPFHQQLPGVHRPHLPGALRGLLHAEPRRRAGHDQDDRERHRRPRLGGRLDQARARQGDDRQDGRGGRLRPGRPRLRPAARPRRP